MLITVFTDEGFGHPAFFPFFIIGHAIWIVVIVLLIVLVARRRRSWTRGDGWDGAQSHGGHLTQMDAEQPLAERFARGDIEEAEYRARLEVLRAQRPS